MNMHSLKKANVKNFLNDIFYNTNLTDFFVDTLFFIEHAQLKKWFKLKTILV